MKHVTRFLHVLIIVSFIYRCVIHNGNIAAATRCCPLLVEHIALVVMNSLTNKET